MHGGGVSVGRYRKLPVEVEAIRFMRPWKIVREFCPEAFFVKETTGAVAFAQIKTLEGVMRVDIGDWIIRGVNGEFYPCKADIFAKTYESIS